MVLVCDHLFTFYLSADTKTLVTNDIVNRYASFLTDVTQLFLITSRGLNFGLE